MKETNPVWRVLLLDTKRSNPNHYICLSIEEALRLHPNVESVDKVQLGDAIYNAKNNHCNLFIAFDGEELHTTICSRLKQICNIAILWVTEDPYELPVNLRNAKIFDLIFTNDSKSAIAYGEKGIHLPLAASSTMHFLPIREDSQCRYDLFFAGTAWPNRVKFFQKIIGSFNDLRVKLALSENPHLPEIKIELPRSVYSWRTPNSEFVRFSNMSKSVINLHRDYTATPGGSNVSATPGPRLFEVAMAGGFQLVDSVLPEVGEYFEIGKEVVTFDNEYDCVEKLRYYLSHPDDRLLIASAAQKRVLKEHTYTHRISKILSEIQKLKNAPTNTHLEVSLRPKVLMVTHNLLGNLPWGGVEVYQNLILKNLRTKFEFWFYVPEHLSEGKVYILYDENLKPTEQFTFDYPMDGSLLSCPKREEVFSKILTRYSISTVHFQHLIHHIPSLPFIAQSLGISTILSLHDYYPLCHHFNLIGKGGSYCEVEKQSETGCDICLQETMGIASGSQTIRRSFFRRVLSKIDIIHSNTQGVIDLYQTIYGNITQHSGLQVMGVPTETPLSIRSGRPLGRLKVAVIGNFTRNKGAEIVLKTVKELRNDLIDFIIYGYIDPLYLKDINDLCYSNLKLYGPFSQGELKNALSEMDVSLHVSIWPETYCLTLSEAWQSGLVPIVSDIGALGERVIDGKNGFKFPPDNIGALIDLLRTLAASPELIDQARRGVSSDDVVTVSTHMKWLEGIYSKLSANAIAKPLEAEPEGLNITECGLRLNSPKWIQTSNTYTPKMKHMYSNKHSYLQLIYRIPKYLRNHGILATAYRIFSEIKNRLT